MELKAIRSFDAVAQTQSLSRAARHVHLAQPALSRRIHALERELGVSLLTRHAKGVALTPAGAVFAGGGRQLLHEVGAAIDRAEATAAGRRGRVVLAATRAAVARGLPVEAQDSLRRDYPELTLVVQDFEQPTAAEAVAAGKADLAVCSDSALPPVLVAEPLWGEQLDRVIVPVDHALAGRRSVSLAELGVLPFVFARGSAAEQAGERVGSALRAAGLRSPIIALEGDVRTAHVAVATQRGWTLITRSRASVPPEGTAVLALNGLAVAVDMIVVWRRDDRRALLQTVVRRLREIAADYPDSRVRVPGVSAPPSPPPPPPPPVLPHSPSPSPARARAYRAPRPVGSVPSDLQLRHLRELLSVTTTPSISRAARRLGMSQPALSRQLRALEQAVGLTLFERSARGVTLTPAGVSLAGDAPALLASAERLAREVDRVKRSVEGRCMVGTVATAAASALIARVTQRCAELYPNLQVIVDEIPSAEQRLALLSATMDLGLAHALPAPTGSPDDRIAAEHLLEDPLECALLAPHHPLARVQTIEARQLADIPFLFMDRAYQPEFYDRVFAALARLGLRPRTEATYDAMHTAWALVAQGKGWTLGFQSHQQRAPAGTAAARIAGFSLPFGIDLLSRQGESAPTVVAVASLFRTNHERRRRPRA
ncbi:MAG TPA: LysR family transcriptional regulator [Gemmatimonadales bacterium]|nr:LysR family transcriptional regulator [Gemmatimonadales bacterium]